MVLSPGLQLNGLKLCHMAAARTRANKSAKWAQAYFLKMALLVLGSTSVSKSPTWIPKLPQRQTFSIDSCPIIVADGEYE